MNRVAADMLVNLGLMLLVALIIRCGSPPGALGGVFAAIHRRAT